MPAYLQRLTPPNGTPAGTSGPGTPGPDPAPSRDRAGRSRVRGAPALLALAAVLASSALRIWNLRTPALEIDGDQAVTGMMVTRMARGDDFYVFIAGQRYNGALEQWVQAAVYRLTGLAQNSFTLRLPEVAWMALATWLVFVVGRRVLLRPWAAAVAAVLFSVGPYWSFWKGNHSDGAYPSLVVVGLLGFWCALRMTADRATRQWLWAAGLGGAAGAIVWLGQSGIWLLLPALIWVAPTYVRSWRPWPVTVLAAVLGAAPSLLWSWKHGIFAPTDIGLATYPTTLGERAHNVFGPLLREFVGVAGAEGAPGWPYRLQHLAIAVLAVGLLVAAGRRRRGLWATITLRDRPVRRPVDALLVSVPIVLGVYVLSKSAWDTANPHYLFAYTPVLIWLVAAALPATRPRVAVPVTIAVVGVFVATSSTFVVHRAPVHPGTSDADLHAAVTYLRAHGETDVYADFWTAMPTMYFAGGALDVTTVGSGGRGKFPESDRAVDRAPTFVYLDSARNDSGRVVNPPPPIRQALIAHGVTFTETHLGSVTVFSHLSRYLRPWELDLGPPPTG